MRDEQLSLVYHLRITHCFMRLDFKLFLNKNRNNVKNRDLGKIKVPNQGSKMPVVRYSILTGHGTRSMDKINTAAFIFRAVFFLRNKKDGIWKE